MKVSRKLQAPVEHMYAQIVNSSIHDIKKQTKKELTYDQLEGFEYNKVFESKQKATIKIIEATPCERYVFETKTAIRNFQTAYTLISTGEESCEVICEETIHTTGWLQQMNDLMVGIALGYTKKRYLRHMLDAMAKTYEEIRAEITTV